MAIDFKEGDVRRRPALSTVIDYTELTTTTESFPRKPFLDRIMVREIPIEQYYDQSDIVDGELLNNAHIKERSDRGVVVAVGDCVPMGGVLLPMPVKVGDVVFYDEFCLNDPVYLNPADKNKPNLPKYYQMRVGDLKGQQV